MSHSVLEMDDVVDQGLNDRVKRGRRVVSWVMIAAGLLYTITSTRLDRGDLAHPGPGLFPLLVGVLAMVSGGLGLLELRRGVVGTSGDEASSGSRPWWFIAAMAVGVVLLPTLGFVVSAFVTGSAVSWVAGQRVLWRALLIGVILAVVSAVLFQDVLGVYLPSSVLDEML